MASQDREGTNALYPGLVLLFSAAFGVLLFSSPPIEPARPDTPEPRTHLYGSVQNVDTRLWEDPLASLGRLARDGGSCEALPTVFQRIGEEPKRIDILGVIVNGARYAGAAETRRRTRYAVLSGLHVSGFVPKDPYHIGVAKVSLGKDFPNDRDPDGESQGTGSFQIPFEVYERWEDQQRVVWVLWLDEVILGDRPLSVLAGVLRRIGQCGSLEKFFPDNAPSEGRRRIKVKFIGPETSTTLKYMVHELSSPATPIPVQRVKASDGPEELPAAGYRQVDWPRPGPRTDRGESRDPLREYGRLFREAQFYSPTATAEDEYILQEVPREQRSISAFLTRTFAPDRTSSPKVNFLRTTPNDGMLAGALVQELRLRGVGGSSRSHIVLVSEWDSDYGRALPQSIRREISSDPRMSEAERIHVFSYLRGLDGRTGESRSPRGGEEKTGNGKEPGASSKDAREEKAQLNAAEGNGQIDYLRRLVHKIRHLQNALARKGEDIDAIGLFGTDVYDKLLILRSLRQNFPVAVFFTTDLDDLLMHPKEIQWTRNLVVASGFGLELCPELQKDILPFRSSYQTAQFLATLLALNASEDGLSHISQEELNREWLETRVFEIGRTRPIDLSMDRPRSTRSPSFPIDTLSAEPGSPRLNLYGLHPDKPTVDRNGLGKYARLAFLFLLLLAFSVPHVLTWTMDRYKEIKPSFLAMKNKQCKLFWIGLGTLAFLAGIGALSVSIYRSFDTEPFFWTEGISVWPTEFLRVVILLLALFFLWRTNRSLSQKRSKLTIDYFDKEDCNYEPHCREVTQKRTCLAKYRKILFSELSGPEDSSKIDVEGLWRNYVCQSKKEVRFIRLFAVMVLYFALCYSLMDVFGKPHVPFRGSGASLDRLFLVPMVVAFALLLFFVVDATRLCKFLGERLTGHTFWPRDTALVERERWDLKVPRRPHDTGPVPGKGDMVVDCWLDIKFFAELTEPVMKLIYYPFWMLALVILSRSSLFDMWETPLGLHAIFGLAFLFAIYSAVALRQTAENIRQSNLRVLGDLLITFKSDEKLGAASAQLELLIRRIKEIEQGAFASFLRQPVFRALLFPFGASSVWLLEYLPFL